MIRAISTIGGLAFLATVAACGGAAPASLPSADDAAGGDDGTTTPASTRDSGEETVADGSACNTCPGRPIDSGSGSKADASPSRFDASVADAAPLSGYGFRGDPLVGPGARWPPSRGSMSVFFEYLPLRRRLEFSFPAYSSSLVDKSSCTVVLEGAYGTNSEFWGTIASMTFVSSFGIAINLTNAVFAAPC